tara:strand:- start:4972 stop:5427 length:456 start_codon:yes stop_codon:yes gene_type:complete
MSVPVQKLEVPEIPGYHLHWFLGSPDRLERAAAGGYEFVDEREVKINNVSLGGDSAISGNTDMGSRVSIVSGQEIGKDGQAVRLTLMKLKMEWWEEDQKLLEARNTQVRDALVGGMVGADNDSAQDKRQRYVDSTRTEIPDFFKRKVAKAA